ncbi:hypothetical protein ACWDA7_30370 [Streptomyces sp. NPDC001156]
MSADLDQPFKILSSYAYFGTKNMDHFLDQLATGQGMVFGDSGAHSARTLGLTLTIEGYAAWCRRWDHLLTLYANLDVIGAPEATWKNQQTLETRYGLSPIPVFHTSAPWSYLERYLDEGYTYIALGKLLGNPVKEVLPWLAKAFKIAEGRAVFHGFGMTVLRALREFPFYSVDSSTWTSPFRFGYMMLFDRGQWVKVWLRDRDAILQHRELIRAHGQDPLVFASRATYNRRYAAQVAAAAWRRCEEYVRDRHGPITIPDGPHNPVPRNGRIATPGLHLYFADATTTNLINASVGVQAARQKGVMR